MRLRLSQPPAGLGLGLGLSLAKNVEESEQLKNMLICFKSVCVHDKSTCNHMEINRSD